MPTCSPWQCGCVSSITGRAAPRFYASRARHVKQIVDAKAQFRSLVEPWADTGTSTGWLMIAVLGGSGRPALAGLIKSLKTSEIGSMTKGRRKAIHRRDG